MREATNNYEALAFLEGMRDEIERQLGSLRVGQGSKTITLPLDSVDITARAVGRVVEVTLTQVFKNPYSEHLEAEYVFPLGGCSSVNGFKMYVGSRTVIGTIQERRQAREEYNRALSEGKRASLLEQERDDVFTMQVGNIPPQEKITVELTYTEKLEFFENGTTELRLPLVVAPRYVPGTNLSREQVGDGVVSDTDLVPDASRISPPRLTEGLVPDVSLTINVELTPEFASTRDGRNSRISDLSCSQHAVKTRTDDGIIRISLAKANDLLNRDFILRWRLVSEQMSSSVVLHRMAGKGARQEGYAMLSLVPPASAGVTAAPRDVIFVLDRSGSMEGAKMVSASRACAILMSTLGPKDRFAINAFDTACEWYTDDANRQQVSVGKFFDANLTNLEKGIEFLRAVTARGGTELGIALTQSLDLVKTNNKRKGRVPVIVVLTDGQIGNEAQLFSMVQRTAGDTRIFTVGIDTAVNCPFLTRLAALGTGTANFVTPGSQLEDALVQVGREIGSPLVTDLEIESLTGGVTIDALAPSRLPDLFAGRTSDCLFRLNCKIDSGAVARFRIRGKLANGRKFTEDVNAQMVNAESISRLWARQYIKELEDEFRVNPGRQHTTKQQIIDLSLKFSVLTKFTAFVAVDQAEVVNTSGEVRHIVQPVHMPDQWEMQNQSGWGGYAQQLSFGSAGGINANFFQTGSQPRQDSRRRSEPGSGSRSLFGSSTGTDGSLNGVPQDWESIFTGSFTTYPQTPQSPELFGQSNHSAPPAPSGHSAPAAAGNPESAVPVNPASQGWNSFGSPSAGSREKSSNAQVPPPPKPLPPSLLELGLNPMPPTSSPAGGDDWKQLIRSRSKSTAEPVVPSPHVPKSQEQQNAPASPPLSAWSTMKKFFSGAGAEAEPMQSPEGAPVSRILNALKLFREAWMASWTEIGGGSVPDADVIENARKSLIEALADHPVGFQVPRLQKFLRTSAIEYVAALQTFDVTASTLYQARGRFNHGLVDAMVEAEDAMVKVQGRQGAFWESIV